MGTNDFSDVERLIFRRLRAKLRVKYRFPDIVSGSLNLITPTALNTLSMSGLLLGHLISNPLNKATSIHASSAGVR